MPRPACWGWAVCEGRWEDERKASETIQAQRKGRFQTGPYKIIDGGSAKQTPNRPLREADFALSLTLW